MSQEGSNQDSGEAGASPPLSNQPTQTALVESNKQSKALLAEKKPSMAIDFEKVKASEEKKMKDKIIHTGGKFITINII